MLDLREDLLREQGYYDEPRPVTRQMKVDCNELDEYGRGRTMLG